MGKLKKFAGNLPRLRLMGEKKTEKTKRSYEQQNETEMKKQSKTSFVERWCVMKRSGKILLTFVIITLLSGTLVFAKEAAKIAVASNSKDASASISNQAGRCPYYIIFNGTGELIEVVGNPYKDEQRGAGAQTADFLAHKGVTVVIAENFGAKMIEAMRSNSTDYYQRQGIVHDVVKQVLSPGNRILMKQVTDNYQTPVSNQNPAVRENQPVNSPRDFGFYNLPGPGIRSWGVQSGFAQPAGFGRRRGMGQGLGCGRGQGRGMGQEYGFGQGRGRCCLYCGMGNGQGRGMGKGFGRGRGQGRGLGQGFGRGRGQGRGLGQGLGRGWGRGRGLGYCRGIGWEEGRVWDRNQGLGR